LQQLFFGALPEKWSGLPDLGGREKLVLGVLAAAFVVIGIAPQFLLTVIEASAGWLVDPR
jgi:NADH-quinone oxidoreductase subunit M